MDLSQAESISIALHAVLWVVGFLVLSRVAFLPKYKNASESKFTLSVIIPARNEENRLPQLLASLKSQTRTPLEIIVVNDHSEDKTKWVAERFGATVIEAEELPSGWLGKPWACHQGAQAARGDAYLFLDADVFLEKDALSRMMEALHQKGGAYSFQPFHHMERPYEQFSIVFNIIQMISSNAFTIAGPSVRNKMLFGPVLLIKKEDYQKAGGHASVRDKVVENYFLSQHLVDNHIPIHCFGGKGAVSFRMYADGFASLASGWAKSFGKGAQGTSTWILLGTIGWLTGCIGTTRHLIMAAAAGDMPRIFLLIFIYLIFVFQINWMGKKMGTFHFLTALLFPVPMLFFVVTFLWSLFLMIFKQKVNWKGRGVSQ